MKEVRTRFAPSPTGLLHIGNARTAIMNWLFSRHSGGKFILRIEDTDLERSSKESEAAILNDLRWLGLDWDEGTEVGGDYGPYRQSERRGRYNQVAQSLLESGKAYHCYCTAEELEDARTRRREAGENVQYDGRCRHLTDADRMSLESQGREPVVRFKVDVESVAFKDLIRKKVSFPGDTLGDFVLMRQNGMPMYNFCCVIDDHDMAITHVIRGDDHVSNTPRQVLIYQAMDWDVPVFAHTPMILGPDKQRLSKRHGATSVSQYKEDGFLSHALVNFLSLLSWSSASGDELLDREQLIKEFDFARVSKSAAVFDTEKLLWMNGQYIRNLSPEDFAGAIRPFLIRADLNLSDEQIKIIVPLFREKVERLAEIGDKVSVLFQEHAVPENDEAAAVIKAESARIVFQTFLDETGSLAEWQVEDFKATMKAVQKISGVKGKGLWMPVRVALTGQEHGPDLGATAVFFGLEKCRRLMKEALE
ncbi:glutamate--tRNA ligase [bacterium]|nr:glutamate--tRNA ligase [bacterium]